MGLASALGEDERVRLDLHPHWRRLLPALLLLPVTVGLTTYLFFLVSSHGWQAALRWVILAAAAVVLIVWVLRPWLGWATTRYVVTDRRILVRTGIARRTGRDIPLNRISDVSFDATLLERVLRCGTLTIESSGEHSRLALTDVPDVERVQQRIYQLSERESQRLLGRPQSI